MASNLVKNYFRMDKLPHIWCPGCGHGIITRAVIKAIDELKLSKDKVCIVSGIGCSSRAPGYLDFNTLHTTHGRALAFATGLKHANPDLEIIVVTGDGDSSAIGGNHLIHAARRNIGITTVVYNNNIYGMTGGQYSPTTPTMDKGTTAPYGNIDKVFDILARRGCWSYLHCKGYGLSRPAADQAYKNGILNNGFSIIDAVSACPTYYGRKNKKGDAVKMMEWLKDHAVNVAAAAKLPREKLEGKFLVGELYNNPQPEYTDEYNKIIESLKRG